MNKKNNTASILNDNESYDKEEFLELQDKITLLSNNVALLEKQLKVQKGLLQKANKNIQKRDEQIKLARGILNHQMEIAKKIQEHLISKKDKKLYSLSFKFSYLPAFGIGGDYLDVIDLKDGKVGVFVLDVSGKSISAALIMAMTKVLFLKQSKNYKLPEKLIATLNEEFIEIFDEGFDDIYCTAFYGIIDTINKTIEYCNAGHPSPIIFNGTDRKEFENNNLPIGLFNDIEYEKHIVSYNDNDKIVFYTDGLLELISWHNINIKDELEFIECIANADLQKEVKGKQLKDDISIVFIEKA